MINFKTISAFSKESGYSEHAIRTKISKGVWSVDLYTKAPDGRILIDVDGYNLWVKKGKVSGKQATRQSSSVSLSSVNNGWNALKANPLVLT